MKKFAVICCTLAFACGARASWYWPFGSDEDEVEPPRISELMEPATDLIEEASDLAMDGKSDAAIEKYRKALEELDRVERENPERARTSEFATLRNKRAYVNATIDSMLLGQVKENAKVVAVSDTTELEKKLAEEKGLKVSRFESLKDEKTGDESTQRGAPQTLKPSKPQTFKPITKREQAILDIANGDYAAAELFIKGVLEAKPNSAMALNLKAAMEMKQGKLEEAEKTLDHAVSTNPRDPSAYCNMAILTLQKDVGNKSVAKRYYETCRAMGGAADPQLEALLK